jgi:hypothetical protein
MRKDSQKRHRSISTTFSRCVTGSSYRATLRSSLLPRSFVRPTRVRKDTHRNISQPPTHHLRRSRRIAGLQAVLSLGLESASPWGIKAQSRYNSSINRDSSEIMTFSPRLMPGTFQGSSIMSPIQITSLPEREEQSAGYANDEPSSTGTMPEKGLEADPGKSDEKVRAKLRESLTSSQIEDSTPGYIYIFRDPAKPNQVKIGKSKRIYQRHERIQNNCVPGLIVCYPGLEVFGEHRAEMLCGAELDGLRKEYPCSQCRNQNGHARIHREWFEVSEELALQVVQKWTNFMRMKPYDSDRGLTDFWWDRINNRERYLKKRDIDASNVPKDYLARHQQWSKFVNIGLCDQLQYKWRYFSNNHKKVEYWKNWSISLFIASILVLGLQVVYGTPMIILGLVFPALKLVPSFVARSGGSKVAQRRKGRRRERNSPA